MTEVSAGTLTDFLLERIAEDEKRNTKHRLPDDFKCPVNPADDITKIGVPVGGHRGDWAATLYPCGHNVTPDQYDAAAVAVPRSARVLAECEAKRRIVRWYQTLEGMVDNERLEIRHNELLHVLTALAHPHADHPDFRPEWRL